MSEYRGPDSAGHRVDKFAGHQEGPGVRIASRVTIDPVSAGDERASSRVLSAPASSVPSTSGPRRLDDLLLPYHSTTRSLSLSLSRRTLLANVVSIRLHA